jgi:hypothetical protein
VAFGGEEELRMAMGPPEQAQHIQGSLRQRHEAVAIAFAAADMEEHPARIDVGHLQVQRLAQTQPAGVDRAQGDAVIEGGHHREDAPHLLGGEDDGEFGLRRGPGEGQLSPGGAVEP